VKTGSLVAHATEERRVDIMGARHRNESGSILILFAFFLVLMIGFCAIGVEIGRWFLVRAELSKSVDAAALAAVKNLGNPNVDARVVAGEFVLANFPSGAMGTPTGGNGSLTFNATLVGNNKIEVDGHVSAPSYLARVFGITLVPVSSTGQAQARPVEIMLVLDRSGSMSDNNGIGGVKSGANAFVDYFTPTQAVDKLGLISFSTGVTVDRALGTNFATGMHNAINAMSANGWTNSEDAIDQSDGPSGFTPQAGVAPEDRIAQFMVFFTDGRANSFRSRFVKGNTTFDAVTQENSNCDPGDQNQGLGNTLYNPTTGNAIANSNPIPTGDGLAAGSACAGGANTHWAIMDSYPVNGYPPPYCAVPENSAMSPYVCNIAETLALQHAQTIKNGGVTVYAIGLGALINEDFLKQIASTPGTYYLAPTGDDLTAIFQHIALDIKLRLVQ
jgi:Flp pilus assembly protein TadG